MMLKYIIMFWHNCISNGLSEKGMHKWQLQHGANKALLCALEQSALWQYSHIMLFYLYFLYFNVPVSTQSFMQDPKCDVI